jgi:N-methylhydantoinase B
MNILYPAAETSSDWAKGQILPTMISTTMSAGQRIYHKQAGAGGWGNPLLRPPEAVARDVRNEKVSLASAREFYGVIMDEKTLAVDEAATQALRRQKEKSE